MDYSVITKHLKNPKDIFIGWWIPLAGGVLCLWGYAFSAYGFSALFKPISQELGFSRTATSFAASITRFEGGIESPLVGWLSDKYGPRVIIFCGVFMVGLGLVLMNWVHSLLMFYLVWSVILSTGINISLGMPMDVAITNWFIKKRGTAIGIKIVFSGLSGTIGLPVITWMIVAFGWRMACVTGGLVMWVFGLPLVYFFIKGRRPEYYGLMPDGATAQVQKTEDVIKAGEQYAMSVGEGDFTPKQAFMTSAFWLIAISYMFHGALYPVMNIHCIPFLTDRGMNPVSAAATMSIYVTASIPARFIGGLIVDRVGTSKIRFIIASAFLMQGFGVTLFLFNQQSTLALYTFFILYGFGMGAAMPMTPAMRARYFGRKHFGVIVGASTALNMPIAVVGPVLAGWIFDVTGSYNTAFMIFAGLLAAASMIMMLARPPRLK